MAAGALTEKRSSDEAHADEERGAFLFSSLCLRRFSIGRSSSKGQRIVSTRMIAGCKCKSPPNSRAKRKGAALPQTKMHRRGEREGENNTLCGLHFEATYTHQQHYRHMDGVH